MIDGLATVVAYRDGRVDIVAWTGGSTPGPDVVMARQNLPLIVNGGAPSPSLDVSFKWGVTLHGAPAVWRTALGIDRLRQSHLCGGAGANRPQPGSGPRRRGRGTGHGTRHQPRVADLRHLCRARSVGSRPVRPESQSDPATIPVLEHQGLLRRLRGFWRRPRHHPGSGPIPTAALGLAAALVASRRWLAALLRLAERPAQHPPGGPGVPGPRAGASTVPMFSGRGLGPRWTTYQTDRHEMSEATAKERTTPFSE